MSCAAGGRVDEVVPVEVCVEIVREDSKYLPKDADFHQTVLGE